MGRGFVAQRADHALAACTEHQRLAERVEQRQGVHQSKVFRQRLAEPNAGIEDDPLARDTRGDGSVAPFGEPVEHLEHHVVVVATRVEVLGIAGRVHQHDRAPARGDHLDAARIVAQCRHVVDHVRARVERGLHHRGAARVDPDRGAHLGAVFDRGDHPLDLVALPHCRSARTRALAADVD